MYLATVLLYPCALAALCVGAGLLVDRLAGGWLPLSLIVSTGAAAAIALSQLCTYIAPLARATPFVLLAAAIAGCALARARLAALVAAARSRPLLAAGPVVAYALLLAPVLIAGRTTFSSFMALADSAVHMMGADYLIHHGQSYAHLDLRNSYGQFIRAYYGTSYPSGADTLFGASATLLGLPLIWAFQPFNAFVLATAFGPAWLIARRVGMRGACAWAAALSAVIPALVYAYDLLGSIKEITALAMMLAAGALAVEHRSWLTGRARGGVPLALVLAAGVSALGAAFGLWALVVVVVLAATLGASLRSGAANPSQALRLVALAVAVGALAALPTLADLRGALNVAGTIASTSNSGNLSAPLRGVQVLGVWLSGSYKLHPRGADATATDVLIAIAIAAAATGALSLLRSRAFTLAGWISLTLLGWLVVSRVLTTWANAKTVVLTSPVVALLAWAGVHAVIAGGARERRSGDGRGGPSARRGGPHAGRRRRLGTLGGAAMAASLLGGALASDWLQYRAANLAPTARYQELAAVGKRFAGQGPALFTDFDEYAMYELRSLDIGGPDFVYPPAALASTAGGYGQPVDLERAEPSALAHYPLIVTRSDPSLPRPSAAYALVWRGSYYEVWRQRLRGVTAFAHTTLTGAAAAQCSQLGALAAHAPSSARTLAAAPSRELVRVSLAHASHPRHWGHERAGLVMSVPGTLRASFALPAAGAWDIWVQGQIMPTVSLAVDGRVVARIGGELGGNSLVPNTAPPVRLQLSAGAHTIAVARGAAGLSPGARGAAVLDAVLLTPAGERPDELRSVAVGSWHELCGTRYQWAELLSP
jgi:hypothetical protein